MYIVLNCSCILCTRAFAEATASINNAGEDKLCGYNTQGVKVDMERNFTKAYYDYEYKEKTMPRSLGDDQKDKR